jgi:hypothetical protein
MATTIDHVMIYPQEIYAPKRSGLADPCIGTEKSASVYKSSPLKPKTGFSDNSLKSLVFGMYGPPPCRKRKVRAAGKVCAYVYGLVGVFNDPGPGWNALRFGPI